MWGTVLLINGILFTIAGTFLVYYIGMAIIAGEWKQFFITLVICIFLGFAEVALGAIAEP